MSQKPEKKFAKTVASPAGPTPASLTDGDYQLIGIDKIDRIEKEKADSYLADTEKWLNTAKDLFDYGNNRRFYDSLVFGKLEENYLYELAGKPSETEEFLEYLINRMCKRDMLTAVYSIHMSNIPLPLTKILSDAANRRPVTGQKRYSCLVHNLAQALYEGTLGHYVVSTCEYVGMAATLAEAVKSIWLIPRYEPYDNFYADQRQLTGAQDRTLRALNTYCKTILHFYRNNAIDVPLFKTVHQELAESLYCEASGYEYYVKALVRRIFDEDRLRKNRFVFNSPGALFNNPHCQADDFPF